MLAKGAIREAIPKSDQFVSNFFVTPKKEDNQYRPMIHLKEMNKFIPYHHFKMEGLKDVKNLLRKGDWMCKIDLKDAYFLIPLSPRSRKLVRFRWKEILHEFLCLAFGLGILRRLGIRLVIYLDDILLMATSKENLRMARDSALYLFHHLGLTMNLTKSVLVQTQKQEYLGILVDSLRMTFSLSQELSLIHISEPTRPY